MLCLQVSIVRCVDEHQPGFVEREFTDATGTDHNLVDKVPVFWLDDLWSDSVYPQPGLARCELLLAFSAVSRPSTMCTAIHFLEKIP